MLYVPGSTDDVTFTAPVVVFSVMPAGHAPDVAMVEFAEVAAAPFTVSLVLTLAMAVDAVPETAVPDSVTGVITALTVIVSATVLQFTGVAVSHNR